MDFIALILGLSKSKAIFRRTLGLSAIGVVFDSRAALAQECLELGRLSENIQ